MPKIWTNNRRDVADLKRRLRKGDTVYTVRRVSRHVAAYEDAELYAEHTFTWRSPATGNLMTDHLSIEGLLAQEGAIHAKPPAGMRNIADPAPQVAGPVPRGYAAHLDEVEIRGLGKQVRDSSNPRHRRDPRDWAA